jgi:peptide/nickel transport system substrate-binding protein
MGWKRPTRAGAVTGAIALCLAVSACAGGASGGSGAAKQLRGDPDTANTAAVTKGGTLTYVLEKNVVNWNPLSPIGSTVEDQDAVEAVMPSVYVPQPDMQTLKLNTDLVTSATQTSTSPQTVVYKINPKAVWSDGKPINADDFIYAWKAQDGKHCPQCQVASTLGYDQIKSVTGSDGGKTVTVVFSKPYGAWQTLFQYLMPSHVAATYGSVSTPSGIVASFNDGFAKHAPTWSGGPFQIQQVQNNQAIVEVPNKNFYGTAPNLDKVIFRVITDATQEVTAFQNGEVNAMYPQPEVDLLKQVQQMQNVNYQMGLSFFWEHFEFNLNNPFLGQNPAGNAIRKAMFTAVNVPGIISKTAGQVDPKVTPLKNLFFMPQQKGYQDDTTPDDYGAGDVAKAKSILTAAGYTGVGTKLVAPNGKPVPALRLRYTTGNQLRQTESMLFAEYVKALGITVDVEPTDDLGATQVHQDAQHDYDIIVFAWVGSPFPAAINAPIYESCKGKVTYCGDNIANYRNPKVDALLKDSVSNLDASKVTADLNQADQQLLADAVSLPLYQRPTFLATSTKYANIRDNPTYNGPVYNIGQWGLRAGSK